jgi:predicted permease
LLLTVAPVAAVALALNTLVENLLVIPLLLALAERSRGEAGHWRVVVGQSLKRLATNPVILSLLAGLLVSVTHVHLPEPVLRTVTLFSVASAGLSLFVIGGTLVGLPLGGMGRQIMPIAFAKLVLHPLAVLLAITALPLVGMAVLEPPLRNAAVLLAAMPMMSIYPILAQTYGKEDLGAAALLVTTVLSFFTLSGLIWLSRVI